MGRAGLGCGGYFVGTVIRFPIVRNRRALDRSAITPSVTYRLAIQSRGDKRAWSSTTSIGIRGKRSAEQFPKGVVPTNIETDARFTRAKNALSVEVPYAADPIHPKSQRALAQFVVECEQRPGVVQWQNGSFPSFGRGSDGESIDASRKGRRELINLTF